MRSPTARILINSVNVFKATMGRDTDGGVSYTYPTSPSLAGWKCSVQFGGVAEVVDDQNRVAQVNQYSIISASNPGVSPRDKLVWIDNGGVTRTLFAQATTDEAGRGAAFVVHAIERL